MSGAVESVGSDPSVDGVCLLVTANADYSIEDVSSRLTETSVPVFGGLFPEVIHEGTKTDTGSVVVGLEYEPTITTVEGLDDPTATLYDELDPDRVGAGYDTAFVLVDAYATRIGEFVQHVFETYGTAFTFVGGGVGALDSESGPTLFTGDGPIESGALLAFVPTESGLGVHHGWNEAEGPFRVTEASGKTVESLNGRPAFDVYREAVESDGGGPVDSETFFETAKSYPFGIRRLQGENIVRDPFSVDDEGAIECFGTVPEDEFVHVLYGDRDSLPNAARTAYEEAVGETGDTDPTLVFFDCISRVQYLEDEFDRELEQVGTEDQPAFGALTIGEIANDGTGHLEFYNKTAVVAALVE